MEDRRLDKSLVGEKLENHYLKLKTDTIHVVGYVDLSDAEGTCKREDFIPKKGYIDINSRTVWIYREVKPLLNVNRLPNFWIMDGELGTSMPSEETMELASMDNVRNRSVNEILREIETAPESEVFSKNVSDMISAGSAMTLPIIKYNDDFLKMIVKAVIRSKRRSLNNLGFIKQQHLGANMRAALIGPTKMSTNYFLLWADMQKFNFTIRIEDAGDPEFPLPRPIVYDVRNNMIYYENPDGSLEADPRVEQFASMTEDDDPDTTVEVLNPVREEDDDPDINVGES